MKIYLDNDFKCHIENADGRTEIETDYFDGKCRVYIEGFRFVPHGQIWTREDGVQFKGEMVSAWKPYESLAMAQTAFEESQQILNDTLSRIEVALGI